ncbi:MAG TPA: response regulator [Terriglobales bacterium]|nr:response regulator [Terriglobales bacterium]
MTQTTDSLPPPAGNKVLFVDDEEGIRLTLPAILQNAGFDVSVAASVPEALQIINHRTFDVLLTDLNIGSPADGFILVSAMRRVQPKAATFILTGYPDFQSALEAIRKQVDDYFTKPADIPTLISTLRERARNPRVCSEAPCKRVSEVVLENSDEIVRRWLNEVRTEKQLVAIRVTDDERIDRLPLLLNDLANALESNVVEATPESLTSAAVHGTDRAAQGYTIPLLVCETRILNRVIAAVLQENLLSINLSSLFPEALKVGEYLQALLEESIRAFQAAEPRPVRKAKVRVA